MAARKPPSGRKVKTIVHHYNDHWVIEPPNRLRDRVQTIGDGKDPVIDAEAIARADAAMAALTSEFSDWMASAVARLADAAAAFDAAPAIAPETSGATPRAAFYRAAHDLRGTAALYGYPVVGRIAGSLCLLLERPIADPRAAPLIDAHVAAIRRLQADGAEAAASPVANDIAEALQDGVARLAAPVAGSDAIPAVDSPPLQAQ